VKKYTYQEYVNQKQKYLQQKEEWKTVLDRLVYFSINNKIIVKTCLKNKNIKLIKIYYYKIQLIFYFSLSFDEYNIF
jgi:isochorismate synthase EntC